MSSAMVMDMSLAGFTLVASDTWQQAAQKLSLSPTALLRSPAAVGLGANVGADAVISGFFSVQDERILVSVSCYDVADRSLAAGFLQTWRFNLAFYNSFHAELESMLGRVKLTQEKSAAGSSAASADVNGPPMAKVPLQNVTFTSTQNGMEVVLAGEKSLGTVQNGELQVEMPGLVSGAPLLIEKRMPGYRTAWQTSLSQGRIALSPLSRETRLALAAELTAGQFLGAGATGRYYLIPSDVFVAASLYPYIQPPASPSGVAQLHIDTSALVGTYLFFGPESLFRMGVAGGVGVILSDSLSGGGLFEDAYLNYLTGWVELNLPAFSVFLQSQAKYTLGIGQNLLQRQTMTVLGVPPITLGVLFKW